MTLAALVLVLGLAQPADAPAAQPAGEVPNLDDLLGLPRDSDGGRTDGQSLPDAAPDPSRTALDRQLTAQQMGEQFRQAVELMGESATRLGQFQDAGIQTQRLQEDILAKLDQIIAAAQQGGGSSSSSSSSSEASQSQQNRQPGQNTSQGSQNGDGSREHDGPERQDGPLNPELQSAHAAWGALPERLRDALTEGRSDQFSSLYRSLTELYYRRLAEEQR